MDYKTLQIRNLRESGKLRSKLLSSDLNKQISLDMRTNLDKHNKHRAYYIVGTLRIPNVL